MHVVETSVEALLPRLAAHRGLAHAPEHEREWLVQRGRVEFFATGEVITKKGEQSSAMFVVLKGHIVIRTDNGAGAHTIFEWKGGDIGGTLPYSRRSVPPSDAVAEADTELFTVGPEHFPEMIRACPSVTEKLVHTMLDRARMFTSSGLRDEKLISLGKLASGIAHELNNPSSAVLRSAKLLVDRLTAAEGAQRRINAAHLSDEQLSAIDEVRAQCTDMRMTGTFSVLARADREEEIADWMAGHDIDDAFAAPLAETTVSIEALDALAEALPADVLPAALECVAVGCTVRTVASEIETAARRMHELVAAVKGFSYMDHAPTTEAVDLRRGVLDTLRLLDSKIRAKQIEIQFDIPADLPCAYGVGGELNQVWMNLIDNALDAAPPNGHVSVTAAKDRDRLIVRVIDDGAGIPAEIRGRIFDPFFTTKGVGKGTGLGLDIVRRLLQAHSGDISLDSVPGRTEFQVRLPIAN